MRRFQFLAFAVAWCPMSAHRIAIDLLADDVAVDLQSDDTARQDHHTVDLLGNELAVEHLGDAGNQAPHTVPIALAQTSDASGVAAHSETSSHVDEGATDVQSINMTFMTEIQTLKQEIASLRAHVGHEIDARVASQVGALRQELKLALASAAPEGANAHGIHPKAAASTSTTLQLIRLGVVALAMASAFMMSKNPDVMKFLDKHFLLVGITFSLVVGLTCPAPGRELEHADVKIGPFDLPNFVVCIIFVLSGLGLDKVSEVNKPKALGLGIFYVLCLTPLLAIPIKVYGDGIVKMELLQGAALFCAVPTTLSSGVAMVKQAKGNVPLALALTTSTNMLGILTIPYLATWIFSTSVAIPVRPMLFKLALQTLVPFVIGLGSSNFIPAVKRFATGNKGALTKTGNCCIFFVVWLMSSSASEMIMTLPAKDLLASMVLAIITHIVYRSSAYFLANAAQFEEKEWVTFVLMCSQKSLPKCVSVLSILPKSLQSQAGTFIIPCIMAHFSQLVIDGYLTQRWEIPEDECRHQTPADTNVADSREQAAPADTPSGN